MNPEIIVKILGIEDLLESLADFDDNKTMPCTGITLDNRTGYFNGGQVQTLDGESVQGYRV